MPLLTVSSLAKAYAAPVLSGIDLTLDAGEVLALTGENGAGKSTLSKIIAGLVTADAGEMQLDGKAYRPASRREAEAAGVRMVMQELGLIGTLSVAENLLLTELPARAGFIDREELHRRAAEQLRRVGLTHLDPAVTVDRLGIGHQQMVEIARGLLGNSRVLILDEPTAMLTDQEIVHLFEQIAALKATGVAIVYISHRLDELRRIADRIAVLRDGKLVTVRPAQGFEHDDIVQAMVGREVQHRDRDRRIPGRETLRIEQFSRGTQVRNVDLRLHAGEIFGLAGLVGSGRTELLRLIFAADARDGGSLYLNGTSSPVQLHSPVDAVAQGIGLLTEDRKSQGLFLTQPLRTNITIANLARLNTTGWIRKTEEAGVVQRWFERLRIRARDAEQHVAELSGGNQQKVLFARWLERDCSVLLLDEPTRGVDVGARDDIYAELDRLAAAGKTLLMVSSDLRELMAMCDRIGVMSAGSLVRVFERGQWSEQALLDAAFAAHRGQHSGNDNNSNNGTMHAA